MTSDSDNYHVGTYSKKKEKKMAASVFQNDGNKLSVLRTSHQQYLPILFLKTMI